MQNRNSTAQKKQVSQPNANTNVVGSLFSQREIKFRGKRIDNGEWIHGVPYFIKSEEVAFIINNCQTLDFKNEDSKFDGYRVIPESIGQSIGVNGYVGHYSTRHENQIELFEGDIVEAMSEGSKGTFVIKFREEGNPCWLLFPNWQSKKHWNISASNIGIKEKCLYDDLKLIGNITDNHGLLEGLR